MIVRQTHVAMEVFVLMELRHTNADVLLNIMEINVNIVSTLSINVFS